jgi:hypothetical protein
MASDGGGGCGCILVMILIKLFLFLTSLEDGSDGVPRSNVEE